MTTKDYYPANTEWEVLDVERIKEDMNYKVKVIARLDGVKIKGTNTTVSIKTNDSIREVRTPYQPRIGQLIKLSRQDA